ncbi:MAG: hypothetical protein IJX05_04765 [Clostridia bacterium]|nr:hypothetical protein [Clostridia bacterium]
MKTRNIIAIAVGAVAVLAIIAVIVLGAITISPASYKDGWIKDASVSVYRSGDRMSVGADGVLVGNGLAKDGEYTASDVVDAMNFSLLSAGLQFNYDFDLQLATDSARDSEMNYLEVKAEAEKVLSGEVKGYTLWFALDQARELTFTDASGKTVTQSYDTVILSLTEDSEWMRTLNAYAFVYSDLYGSTDDFGVHNTYYKLALGAKTSTALDILTAVYGEESEEEEEETEEEGTEGEETEEE